MSRLEELISQYCPNGVEYRKVRDIADYEQPSKYLVKSTDYNDNFEIPVLTAGQTFILGYTNEKEGIYNASPEKPVIIFDDFTGAFKWVDFPFKAKSSAMKMITSKSDVLIRYLYHLMGFLNYSSDEHKRLWISVYSELQIPVPPLEVQCEIVHILDNFTELTVELTAELTARKKQFDFYRSQLLEFDKNVDIYELQDVCEIIDCPHTSPKWKDEGIPVIRNYNLVNGYIDTTKLSYVDEKEYLERTKRVIPSAGDILFSREAPIGNVGIIPENFKCCQGQRVVLLRPNTELIESRFLMHILQGEMVRNQILSVEGKATTVSNFNISDLRKLKFQVPSKKKQNEIIKILDVFMDLSAKVSEGLPAEIEARKKQYEYYRDKLLSFKELPK